MANYSVALTKRGDQDTAGPWGGGKSRCRANRQLQPVVHFRWYTGFLLFPVDVNIEVLYCLVMVLTSCTAMTLGSEPSKYKGRRRSGLMIVDRDKN